jgi:O-methyltransferase involved in polyketide biosynthesis
MEDDEEESARLVYDPLANMLAGKKALAAAKKRRVKAASAVDGATIQRKYVYSRIAIRTRWFDDQLEESLGMPDSYRSSPHRGHVVSTIDAYQQQNNQKSKTLHRGSVQFPIQVVELGAGLSTRPWRLHLPANLRWFDVDRQDVIDAKEDLLMSCGAEVDIMSPLRRSQSKNSVLERQIGSLDHHSLNVTYPIRCESRASVAADLGAASWSVALKEAGFDPSKPTVWIAEGLLMYLTPERVDELLQEIRGLSSIGSCLITGLVTEDVLVENSAAGRSGLMKEWKSGCPKDPTAWMKSLGWNVQRVSTRAKIAKALDLNPEWCSFETDPDNPSAAKGLFVVATLS